MGALGRCGGGAVDFARKAGIPEENIIKWDMNETKGGGPFPQILDAGKLLFYTYKKEMKRRMRSRRRIDILTR